MQQNVERGNLIVSSKILGHVSEGLYRGPAGVLKELISNAFDANARTVWISTGRPTFDVVSIQDDGDGMTLDKFKQVMSGGIGNSDKRRTPNHLVNERPVIGRLGIGILAISQISHDFSIVSHSRATGTAFRANIWMQDFRSQILDRVVPSTSGNEEDGGLSAKGFPVGSFEAEKIEFDPTRTGTTIVATEPTEGFRKQLSEDRPDPLPKQFLDFCKWSGGRGNLDLGSLYQHMVWQLSSLAPIPYLAHNGFWGDADTTNSISKLLIQFDFSVMLDGVKLFKPVLMDRRATEVLRDPPEGMDGPFLFPLEFDEPVWGANLKARGYIYSSAGLALHPTNLRGIIIRIKHIGIGEYDKTFLGYRVTEGPRFAWLTGELFVDEGLEDALTVGRDGFDTGHPHYIALRAWLHKELRSRVFPALHRGVEVRRSRNEAKRVAKRSDAFLDSIKEFVGKPFEIRHVESSTDPAVQVNLRQGVATVNAAAEWPRGKKQRELCQKLGIVFELARCVDSQNDEISSFIQLTRQILAQS